MIKTTRGLPNTCSRCATPIEKKDGWFAKNEDEARSGLGLCGRCVKAAQKPEAPAIQEQQAEAPAPISEGVEVSIGEELKRRK